jgi:hypothetical protein
MKASITPVKHLTRDLITSGYSSLIDSHQKYANYAEKDHGIANKYYQK